MNYLMLTGFWQVLGYISMVVCTYFKLIWINVSAK